MIKRFSKKQGSKQGVILLTVVFILAMAVIFISACMVMTQATRNRLYWKAEQSQARLTVTSAAEAFYQALEVGDFQEGQLKKLAKAGASGIFMTAKDSGGNYLPGMSPDLGNCTLLSLKAKDSACSEIYAYLATTIDGETEKVKITFKVKSKPKVYGLFGNPVDYNGTVGQLNFEQLGYVIGGGSKSDNFLVIRKGSNDADSSSNIWSNVVFVNGDISAFRGKMQGDADMVFLKDAKWAVGIDNPQPAGTNTIFFVSDSDVSDSLTMNTKYEKFQTSSPIVFVNRKINNQFVDVNSSPVYSIDVSGSVASWNGDDTNYNSGGTTLAEPSAEALAAVYDDAAMYSSSDFTTTLGEFPTTEQAFAQLKLGDDPLPKSAPDTFTEMTLAEFETAYGNTSASGTKIVGNDDTDPTTIETVNIKISTGGSLGSSDFSGSRVTFLFDGNTDYVIYFAGSGTTYALYKSTFAVLNPSAEHSQLIVLESGVDLILSTTGANGKEEGAGFLSVPRGENSTAVDKYLTYIYGTKIATEEMSATAQVSSYYDSKVLPTFYVIGAGDNQVTFGAGSYFEGYLGLFNPASATTTSGVSCCSDGGNQYLYGRMMFDGWNSGGDAGRFYMPYCPGPNNGGDKPDVELYKFGYSVVSVDYYYVD